MKKDLKKDKKEDSLILKEDSLKLRKDSSKLREDSTKYGEFVSSFFSWMGLSKQKERAEDLEKMTEDNKDVNNK